LKLLAACPRLPGALAQSITIPAGVNKWVTWLDGCRCLLLPVVDGANVARLTLAGSRAARHVRLSIKPTLVASDQLITVTWCILSGDV
jgi:hypothetical protein